ncbi:MAG TPA: KH domain-containing protein [Myxococcota bacterium]|nr:KH domain-containing protein [Myxococcota bacterium]
MESPHRPRELLSFIVGALVDKAEAVSIEEIVDEHSRVFKLRVDQADIGRVIGKDGRTAKAIRTIIGVATARDGQKAKLDIVDPD